VASGCCQDANAISRIKIGLIEAATASVSHYQVKHKLGSRRRWSLVKIKTPPQHDSRATRREASM